MGETNKPLTDVDIVEFLLQTDSETFNVFYEACRQFGANYVAVVLSAIKLVREMRQVK